MKNINHFAASALRANNAAVEQVLRECGARDAARDVTPAHIRINLGEHQMMLTKKAVERAGDPNCGPAATEPKAMPANPKQAYGDTKVPVHLFPMTATVLGAMALLEGREKYGDNNFRAAPVEAMTYVRACLGHIMSYAEGQNIDPDSNLPELAKALACIAILIDATYAGSLIDNRKFPGGYHKAVAEMQQHVQRIREQHAGKNPKHFTIADKPNGEAA